MGSACCGHVQCVQSSEKGQVLTAGGVDRHTWVLVPAPLLTSGGAQGSCSNPLSTRSRVKNETGHMLLWLFDFVSKIRFLVFPTAHGTVRAHIVLVDGILV